MASSPHDRRCRVVKAIVRNPTITSSTPPITGTIGSPPVGGNVPASPGATGGAMVDPPAPGPVGVGVVGGVVVTAATAVASLVIVTVTDWFAATLNTGGAVLGPPPPSIS